MVLVLVCTHSPNRPRRSRGEGDKNEYWALISRYGGHKHCHSLPMNVKWFSSWRPTHLCWNFEHACRPRGGRVITGESRPDEKKPIIQLFILLQSLSLFLSLSLSVCLSVCLSLSLSLSLSLFLSFSIALLSPSLPLRSLLNWLDVGRNKICQTMHHK